ncbi:MAG: branched-chain amino acid ABC transporter permease [Coriobacteriia bacterium]|nr:branched-chain amino acid ABC transporter permease [Coriobacteriia bacterium]
MGGAWRRHLPAIVSAALAVVVLALPLAVSDRYLLKVFMFVGLNVITVAGLAVLFGLAGQVSLGHAAFVGIGAYACGFLTARAGWPWPAAVVAAVAIAAAGGLALALPTLRLRGHYLGMATLGFSMILGIAFVEAKAITGGNDGLSGIPLPAFGALDLDPATASYLLVWGTAVLVLLLASGIVRGRPGRAMTALHGSEMGAQACGIDPIRVKVTAFTLSAALAGLSGALYALTVGFVSPTSFALETSIILLAMVVLGGTRSLAGPVLAAVLLTLLTYVDAILPGLSKEAVAFLQDWKGDIYGVVIVAVMLFAPAGIAGVARTVRTRLGGSS